MANAAKAPQRKPKRATAPRQEPRKKKRAIALAGGGPAAGLHIGALEALEQHGVTFDVWSLSCIGAWVGVYYNQLKTQPQSIADARLLQGARVSRQRVLPRLPGQQGVRAASPGLHVGVAGAFAGSADLLERLQFRQRIARCRQGMAEVPDDARDVAARRRRECACAEQCPGREPDKPGT